MSSPESQERPIILGAVGETRSIRGPRGGPGRVNLTNQDQRVQRLDSQFDALQAAIGDQIQLADSIQAADPQLVVVMEARDETVDLTAVAERLGFEIITETESRVQPDDEFELKSANPRSPLVSSCLHAVCVNQTTLEELLSLWRMWRDGDELPRGRTPLREFFVHLKDVRPWGPQDRLKLVDWDLHFGGLAPDVPVPIDIELWYRRSPALRATAQAEVVALLRQDGGDVTTTAVIDEVGYHGMKATVPSRVLAQLARGEFDTVQTVKSANVLYLRATGQSALPSTDGTEEDLDTMPAAPAGDPVLCLLDGVPAANHPLLLNRVALLDPDDLESDYTADERRHGTAMASAAVWGDRNVDGLPAARPVLLRPILRPCEQTVDRAEEVPTDQLAPDLMVRAFRDLFEPAADGTGPAAPQIAIINLSVGDPATPFDTVLSAWARTIDWLSYHYGVLVVVSAGNYTTLDISPSTRADLEELTGPQRRHLMLDALDRQQNQRRIIAPGEAINALTVGAIHADAAGDVPLGYRVDPADGLISISPVTATGSGYRRALKPDLAASGGRAFYSTSSSTADNLHFRKVGALGPGIKVAAPTEARQTHTVGTSVAAVLVSRQAARLHDLIDSMTVGGAPTRHQRASAIKALLIHGVTDLAELSASPLPLERAIGNGVLTRDFSEGCASNEAVLLFLGQIGATEEQELQIPLPDGLSARDAKRIDTTLAWLSPTNWRHRQYRRAALSFVKPEGAIPSLGSAAGLSADTAKAGSATIQHLSWETRKAWASGRGSSITIRVKCFEQAGGLQGDLIDYAAVASIWVDPEAGIDVYNQVLAQVQTPIQVAPN